MQIRTKIALQFSLIVFIILGIFSVLIYLLSEDYRKNEFYQSLSDRAITSARLLIKERDIDKKLLKIIDKNTLNSLIAAQILVFNENNQVTYSNFEADTIYYSPDLLKKVREQKYIKSTFEGKQVVGTIIQDPDSQKDYIVLAQGEDIYGQQKLKNIREILISGLLINSLITIVFGFMYASQALKPISNMNDRIRAITANNLKNKLQTGNNKDEIAQLAKNFNDMLARLENAFELQKGFVSNASHELRTPLAAIKSEIQVALEKSRSVGEYQEILGSVLSDNQKIIKLINSLLQLAKTDQDSSQISKANIRIDEILYSIQEEVNSQELGNLEIVFNKMPKNFKDISIFGNKELIQTLFFNLIENALKYSENKNAKVLISFNDDHCEIKVKDKGIGIEEKELEKIFQPFYRVKGNSSVKGNGIGLSICKKIIDLHSGEIKVQSKPKKGTEFTVILPHNFAQEPVLS